MNHNSDSFDVLTPDEKGIEDSTWRRRRLAIALIVFATVAVASLLISSNIGIVGSLVVTGAVLGTTAISEVIAAAKASSSQITGRKSLANKLRFRHRKSPSSVDATERDRSAESIAEEDRLVTEFVNLIEEQKRNRIH